MTQAGSMTGTDAGPSAPRISPLEPACSMFVSTVSTLAPWASDTVSPRIVVPSRAMTPGPMRTSPPTSAATTSPATSAPSDTVTSRAPST